MELISTEMKSLRWDMIFHLLVGFDVVDSNYLINVMFFDWPGIFRFNICHIYINILYNCLHPHPHNVFLYMYIIIFTKRERVLNRYLRMPGMPQPLVKTTMVP